MPRTELVRFKVDVGAADVVVGKVESYLSDPVVELLGFRRSRFPATHSWPPVIDVPPESRARPYNAWRADLDLIEPTPAAAASALRSFLEPVYFGVAGRSWDPAAQRWR